MSIRTLAAFSIVNISILIAGYAHAAPRAKGKVVCEVDTIRHGQRVRLDPADYTAREAVAIVTVVNKTGSVSVFAVCGIETVAP